jgi:inositol 1,4,5-triphosphate receptor type 1
MFYLWYELFFKFKKKKEILILVFIIGLDRKSFDNKHVTFEDHIRKVHNMWNYVYFMVLINVKDPTEYTGPESYVHEMIEVRNFS